MWRGTNTAGPRGGGLRRAIAARALRGATARARAVAIGLVAVAAIVATTALGSAQTTDAAITAPAVPVFRASARVTPGRDPIPILMYHVIACPDATVAFPGLWVCPSEFAGQMHALKAAGYHAISLDEAWAYWHYGAQLPAHPIIITFDNGYASQYTAALPVLRAMGWIAVLNFQLSLHAPVGLSPVEVRHMVADGWELDSQTFTHPDLPTLDTAQLEYQIVESRKRIQRNYGVPAYWFCYPSGHYDQRVVDMVKAAGYRGSTTVIFGWGSPTDTYRLARLRVLGGTSPQALLAQIADNRDDPPPPSAYPAGA